MPTPAYQGYHAYGDSITAGQYVTFPESYVGLLAADLNLAASDYAIPGDQACDIATKQIFPNQDNPVPGAFPLYTLMVGTNDEDLRGADDYLEVFNACERAAIGWLALPSDLKVLATATGVTTSGFGAVNPANHWNAWETASTGSSITFPVSLETAGAVYLWPRVVDNDPGTFTYAIDGMTLGASTTATKPYIATQSGTTDSLGFIRIPSVSAGSHTVTFTLTSTSGTMRIVAVGVAPASKRALPTVVVGDPPNQMMVPDDACVNYPAICAAYPPAVEASVALFQGDGLDVRYAENHTFMGATAAEMANTLHPNAVGQSELRQAFEAVLP